MKLTQLEYFCAAVECRSITAAAKKLYVTQPAISGAIPDLVGIPIVPRIEQKVGLLWRRAKYTPSGVESFISFVRDYPLFPEMP